MNRTNLWIAAAIVSQFAWAGTVIACHDNNSPQEPLPLCVNRGGSQALTRGAC